MGDGVDAVGFGQSDMAAPVSAAESSMVVNRPEDTVIPLNPYGGYAILPGQPRPVSAPVRPQDEDPDGITDDDPTTAY